MSDTQNYNRLKLKSAFWICISISVFILSSISGGCKKNDVNDIPRITTDSITYLGMGVVSCGGTITYFGHGELKQYGVCWSRHDMPTISDSKEISNSMNSDFRINITRLADNTTYFVRAFATNSAGTGYGNQLSIKTPEAILNSVNTLDIKSITKTSAIMGGKFISGNFYYEPLDWGVCWGTAQDPEKNGSKFSIKVGSDIFATTILGLTAGTEYFVKAYITSKNGTGYGEMKSFTTLPEKLPELITGGITSITKTSAICGGNVIYSGGVQITENGIFWGTSPDPQTTGTKFQIASGEGSFSANLSGLTPGTVYYIRAYAINSFGAGYGPEVTFGTDGTLTDIDGNIYNTIAFTKSLEITTFITSMQTRYYQQQYWMKENLRTTKYNDGKSIPLVTDNELWASTANDGYCWYNNDPGKYKETYGALYNFKTVYNNSNNICPQGWSISYYNFNSLAVDFLGSDAGGKLKSVTGWSFPNTGATNESRFSALPGGYRNGSSGQFFGDETEAYFSIPDIYGIGTPYSEWRNYALKLEYNSSSINYFYNSANDGFSVRCSKNSTNAF